MRPHAQNFSAVTTRSPSLAFLALLLAWTVSPAVAAAPAPAASEPLPGVASPAPPVLAAPPLLLPESLPPPAAEQAKGPSWGLILGGAAVAILAGLGLTLLLDSRQPHPQLPIPAVEELGSPRAPAAVPVVEALDLGDSSPPPAADAAARPLTPIAPHVPLPPLRGLGGPETGPGAPPLPASPTGAETGKPAAPSGGPEAPAGTPSPATKPAATPPASSPPKLPPAPASPTPGESPAGNPALPSLPDSTGAGKASTPGTGRPAGEQPASPPSATTPTEPKDKNPDDLMKEAQAAYVRGERGRATELALQVAEGGGPDAERAWRFIGSAACSVRNALMANKADTTLESSEHKQMLQELCQRNGLSFQNGSFGPPSPGAAGSSGSSGSSSPE
jgi:hypothetical protein